MHVHNMEFIVGGSHTRVLLGNNVLSHIAEIAGNDMQVIVDANVAMHHEIILGQFLDRNRIHLFRTSEKTKTLSSVESLAHALVESGATRKSTLVVIGGGVLGDLGGFLAASYMRGIRLIHVPTTLIAMVDSSLGGKNGINLQSKNMLGTIYQPHGVIIDPIFLSTLPEKELQCGIAEVIKYGCISHEAILTHVEQDKPINTELIHTCVKAKMEVVTHDPHEKNLRMVLNFGHTIGHAIESATHYTRYSHGEAVAIGMVAEAQLAAHLHLLAVSEVNRLKSLLEKVGLPTRIDPTIPSKKILSAMSSDKKRQGNGIPFVFPKKLGAMRAVKGKYLHMVSEDLVKTILQ